VTLEFVFNQLKVRVLKKCRSERTKKFILELDRELELTLLSEQEIA
jgi:hypothetical protein